MNNPRDFYTSQIKKHRSLLKNASRMVLIFSVLRLFAFLGTAFLLYYFFGEARILAAIFLTGTILFLFLVSRHSKYKNSQSRHRELIKINETEIAVQNRNFGFLPTGAEFDDPNHLFSKDIDLFGKASFFQYLNRTALPEGRKKLAEIVLSNDTSQVTEKQQAVKELAHKAEWRQHFSAVASLIKSEGRGSGILEWLQNYKKFLPDFMRWLPAVFAVFSAGVIAAFFLDYIGGLVLALWLFLGLGFTGIFLKKINEMSTHLSKAQDLFHQYYQLLEAVEEIGFSSKQLRDKQRLLSSKPGKASRILKRFSKYIDSLDQRNNMLFGVLANGFLLWDLRCCYRLERWIEKHSADVAGWFNVIEHLDAYNSLGNFAFNHPSYIFPEIEEEGHVTQAEQVAHPLLDPKKRVANDFRISGEQFFIITGANMAGKSTFLRTIALQILMGNVGLPICADYCSYSPIKLITSMRTSDSLSDDESYFFSELKRLRLVVDKIREDNYFVILDEILKGTNSTDKAKGSRKFVEKLVASRSTGIIATHDLSLCEVAKELQQVENYYFDGEIVKGELFFDYTLKKGICQNMNASFLLKKMGIVD